MMGDQVIEFEGGVLVGAASRVGCGGYCVIMVGTF